MITQGVVLYQSRWTYCVWAALAGVVYRCYSSLNARRTPIEDTPLLLFGLSFFVGLTLFCYYGHILMGPKRMSERQLLTGGFFKYTRHPQYTGLVLLDMINWFTHEKSIHFWIAMALIYIPLCAACYFQEKETLARFGEAAEAYYAETPRIFFFYPIRKVLLI